VAADFEDSLRGASKSLFPYHAIVGVGGIDGSQALSQEPDSTLSGLSPIGRRTWVAVKLTAMLPNAHALISFSKCITLTRERMQSTRSASIEPTSDHQGYERLHSISQGRHSVPVELIPFPGSPIPSDMDLILSSTEFGDGSCLTAEDIRDLRALYNDLVSICTRAQERGVKLILDAEYRSVVSLSYIRTNSHPFIVAGINLPWMLWRSR
jgi:proline dehydrogenase